VLDLDGTSDFTVSAWFKVEGPVDEDHGAQIIAQDFKSGVGWNMYCYAPSPKENRPNGSVSCYVSDGTTRAKCTFTASDGEGGFDDFLDDEGWHHLAITFDATEHKLRCYIDGQGSGDDGYQNGWTSPEGNTTGDGTLTNDNFFRLGCNYSKGNELDGSLDDFAFWSRCLTDAEILSLLHGPPPPPIPGDTDNNGIVNEADAAVLAAKWGASGEQVNGAADGDFNGDDIVNVLDAAILAANWGNHNPTEGSTAVPEPTGLVMVVLGALMLLARRRRPSWPGSTT
jgi:hypothetical protein